MPSWGSPGVLGALLGLSWRVWGPPSVFSGMPEGPLGAVLDPPAPIGGPKVPRPGPYGPLLGRSWAPMGPLPLSGLSWAVLGPSSGLESPSEGKMREGKTHSGFP
eukprot:6214439-Pyramimonas_sp.AAC.1